MFGAGSTENHLANLDARVRMCERVCSKRTQKLIWIFKQCASRTLEKDCRAAAYIFPAYGLFVATQYRYLHT